MRYIDPYAFLQLPNPEALDAGALRRARQRILAEYSLSGTGYVEFEGEQVEQATALTLLDMLENENHRIQFWKMRTVRGLAKFLKGQNAGAILDVEHVRLGQDADLREFCSHFIAPIYDRHLGKTLEMRYWGRAEQLLRRQPLLGSTEVEAGFRSARRYVQGNILQLEAALSDSLADPLPFAEAGLIHTLNAFPEQFQQLRNNYAVALRDLALALDHTDARVADALVLINAACDLHQDPGILNDNLYYKSRIAAHFDAINLAGTRQAEQRFQTEADQAEFQRRQANIHKRKRTDRIIVIGCIVAAAVGVIFAVLFWLFDRPSKGAFVRTELELPVAPGFSWQLAEGKRERLDALPITGKGLPDLVQSLRRHHLKSPEPGTGQQAARPENGSSPFEAAFPPISTVGLVSFVPIHLTNDSPKDLILLVENVQDRSLVAHFYVRAGEALPDSFMVPRFEYVFAIYNGTGWQDSVATLGGITLPGFGGEVDFVGTTTLAAKSTAPYLQLDLTGNGSQADPHLVYHDAKLNME